MKDERRERYRSAIVEASYRSPLAERLADAAMAVADAELAAQPVYAYDGPEIPQLQAENARLRAELDDMTQVAQGAIERMRALHVNTGDAWESACGYCCEAWPCTTEEIAREALNGETR